jgi:hypothetical protein
MTLVRIRAKSLISNRNSVQKFYTMGAQLQGLGLRLTTMASTSVMTDAMKVISNNLFLYLYLTTPLAGRMLSDVSAQRGARPAQNPAVRYIFHTRVVHDPLNFVRICRIVRDFERQSSEMDMKGEMMVSAGFKCPKPNLASKN